MKKIPCLFVRDFYPRPGGRGQTFTITDQVTPGLEWVLRGKGVPTRKWDGTACMIRDGKLFRRYDAKAGKAPPAGAIPCDDPDPVTGHWPHWIPVVDEPESKWHRAAFEALQTSSDPIAIADGTYELCGPHVNGNPQKLDRDELIPHGKQEIVTALIDLSFYSPAGFRSFLNNNPDIEGIVWWRDGEPRAKLRRADYGFPWGSGGRR